MTKKHIRTITDDEKKLGEDQEHKERMKVLAEFRAAIEMEKARIMEKGYLVELFAGVTEPYGEMGVKFKCRKLTTEEMAQIQKDAETKKIMDSMKA